jgi:hypothetical protein
MDSTGIPLYEEKLTDKVGSFYLSSRTFTRPFRLLYIDSKQLDHMTTNLTIFYPYWVIFHPIMKKNPPTLKSRSKLDTHIEKYPPNIDCTYGACGVCDDLTLKS